jgi:nitrogen regulatory protein PII
MGIKKIEALIFSSDVQAVEEALGALGIDSVLTTPSVRHRQGSTLYYRGAAYESNSNLSVF